MRAGSTLSSRGFELPAARPNVGRRDLDKIDGWHAMALRLVIRDFLEPDLAGSSIQGPNSRLASDVINRAGARDGFEWMSHEIHLTHSNPRARERVAAWIGVPVIQIWPHHVEATSRPVRAWHKAATVEALPPPVTTQSDGKAEENPSLMGGDHIAPHVFCLPFVHTAPKRVNVRLAVAAAAIAAGLARFLLGGRQ
jgi:hypothetical protein